MDTARKARAREIAKALATLLGSEWEAHDESAYTWGWPFVARADDQGYGFELHIDRGRLRLAGMSPRGANGASGLGHDEHWASITVSAQTDVPKIAQAVERRLLPVYADQYARQLRANEFQKQWDQERRETEERIKRIVHAYWERRHEVSLGYEMAGSNKITLTLRSVPIEMAERVIALLSEEFTD